MAAGVTFLHLSDTHIVEGDGELLGMRPSRALRATLERIAGLPVAPDCCLITGDLAHDSGPAGYAFLRELLAPLAARGLPILVGLGNHDDRRNFRQGFLGETAPGDGRYYHSATIAGLRIVTLDTLVPGAVHGELGAEQLAWLAAELRQPAPGGTVLALHHPLTLVGMPWLDGIVLRDAAALAVVIAGSGALGIVAGHIHTPSVSVLAGVPLVTAPAVAFQFRSGDAETRIVHGSGFNLCAVRDGALSVAPVIV